VPPPYPPKTGTERETLVGYLDWYRAIMIDKASGLTPEQANTTFGPSKLSVINLVHHLAIVEHWWFHVFFAGGDVLDPWAEIWDDDPDWEFHHSVEFGPDEIIRRYESEIERANAIIEATDDLEALSVKDRDGERRSLRWILAHMLEETARPAAHADLLRESIDGSVGDFRESDDDTDPA
jgi:uncharacterized damage-inducible protein DinB